MPHKEGYTKKEGMMLKKRGIMKGTKKAHKIIVKRKKEKYDE